MALTVVEMLRGKEYAQMVALLTEYDPAPPVHTGSPHAAGAKLTGMARDRFEDWLRDTQSVATGDASMPAVLLLHGFPGSTRYCREVVPELSQAAYVIAPDLPGFGESDVLPAVSFPAFGQAISELMDRFAIGARYIYLHDFGAPVGFHIAMQAPQQVLGLIVQNANAHRTGLGPPWAPVMDYWIDPNAENEAAATAHARFHQAYPNEKAKRRPGVSDSCLPIAVAVGRVPEL